MVYGFFIWLKHFSLNIKSNKIIYSPHSKKSIAVYNPNNLTKKETTCCQKKIYVVESPGFRSMTKITCNFKIMTS